MTDPTTRPFAEKMDAATEALSKAVADAIALTGSQRLHIEIDGQDYTVQVEP